MGVAVRTSVPGASPEEVEAEVSQKIEEVVNTVDGISELRSISSPGSSLLIVTFDLNRDIESAANDIRDRVATVVRDLPRNIDPPVISKFDNSSSPILTVALSGNRSLRELSELADKVVKIQLERASGVGEVNVVGHEERNNSTNQEKFLEPEARDFLDVPDNLRPQALIKFQPDIRILFAAIGLKLCHSQLFLPSDAQPLLELLRLGPLNP